VSSLLFRTVVNDIFTDFALGTCRGSKGNAMPAKEPCPEPTGPRCGFWNTELIVTIAGFALAERTLSPIDS